MFCLLSCLCFSYTPSQFGYPGTDTVMNQEGDSFEVLNPNVGKPSQNIKNIRLSGFAGTTIASDDLYPWSGHNYRATDDQINTEASKSNSQFCKAYQKLDGVQLYYHPAGIKQYTTNATFIKEIQEAPRISLRMWINSRIRTPHWTSLYALPGEPIKVEIPPFLKGKAEIYLNHNTEPSSGNIKWRLPNSRCKFTLPYETNYFSWPIGGAIDIIVPGDQYIPGIEVKITGAIRMPHFRYGVNTDQEWEEELRDYKAPLAVFDTGAIVCLFPADRVRGKIKLNDAGAFWRTVSRIFYSFNDVPNYDRRWNSDRRVVTLMQFNFDNYVRFGAAFAMVGANFIQAPPGWADAMINYDSAKWGCWGNVHEYGHHFQAGWGIEGTGETTNNAANFITYALITEIDSTRQCDMANNYRVDGGGWNWVTHEFSTINFKDGYNGPLVFYGNMVYWFGHEKWRPTLYAHVHNRWSSYHRDTYGYHGEFILQLAQTVKRDLRPYFSSFPFVQGDRDFRANVNETFNQKFKNLKEFHPVTNIYAVGYVMDGVEFETHKPYQIGAHAPYYFDFERTKKTRAGMHTFTFDSIDSKPSQGKFEKLECTGCFKYTPPSNISVIDKFYVNYKDDKNKEITKVVVKIRQIVKGCRMSFMKLPSGTYNDAKDADKAYNDNLGKVVPTILRAGDGIKLYGVGAHNNYKPWAGVTEGVLIPPNTTSYRFSIKYKSPVRFYLSEKTLSGDPDSDKDYLIADLTGANNGFKDQKLKAIELTAGKRYNFRLVVLGNVNGAYAEVGYSLNKGPFVLVPAKYVYYPECSDSDVVKYRFLPRIEQEPTFGKFYDTLTIPLDTSIIKLTKYPKADDSKFDMTTLITNDKGNNAPNSKASKQGFPYVYTIDFGRTQSFNEIWTYTPPNNKDPMDSNLSIHCDGKHVRDFYFKTRNLDILGGNEFSCKTLDIKVMTNTKGDYSSINNFKINSKTASKTKNIIPATSTGFSVNNNKNCYLTTQGLYYNGKGWHLEKGCSLKMTVQLNSTGETIAILGDKSRVNAGTFDVYIDGDKVGTVDTNQLSDVYKNTDYSMYQQLLFFKNGLKNATDHDFELKVTSGKVRIAGLMANTNATNPREPYFVDEANAGKVTPKSKITTQYVVALFISACTGLVVLVYAGFVVYKKWIEIPTDDPF